MTSFSFLVSDSPLKEVDYSGITEVTVGELKKIYPITENTPAQPWHSMDDHVRILHAADASAFGELVISLCKDPPFDLTLYTEKQYTYWIEGHWKGKFLSDFVAYIKAHIQAHKNVELLIFWAGDGEEKMVERTIRIEDIEPKHLEMFKQEENIRVYFV
ncbi:hypothetical protein J2Z40_002696 [Cytobacillus eiseniae]|uniref:Uncharacterized protein n=1 Tax=Cytobacillus eiseniae TaxID=762947 RepID=A0ABS4RH92_9BACI|nr:hypothetical protein [Cytobacillus eiseniae]MBP2242123.1 hypothetical protein [Cytobacillus eiseniae]